MALGLLVQFREERGEVAHLVGAVHQQGADPAVRLLARTAMRRTEDQARALLVHCAHEMSHLAVFLPELHKQAEGH